MPDEECRKSPAPFFYSQPATPAIPQARRLDRNERLHAGHFNLGLELRRSYRVGAASKISAHLLGGTSGHARELISFDRRLGKNAQSRP